MSISAYELGQYKQIFDRLQYGKTDNPMEIMKYKEFSEFIADTYGASDKEIKAVEDISVMFSETINNSDISEAFRDAAEASLKQLADKGYPSAQEEYVDLMYERKDYDQAYTYANDIVNSDYLQGDASPYDDDALKKDQVVRDKMSKQSQKALTAWSQDISEVAYVAYMANDEKEMDGALTKFQDFSGKFSNSEEEPDWKKELMNNVSQDLAGMIKGKEMSPELREKAQASLKQMADKGYFRAQQEYAYLMERSGNYEQAHMYMNKVAMNNDTPEGYKKLTAAIAQDYLYDGKYKDSFDRLGKGQMAAEDVHMCKEFCEKAKPDLIGTERTNEAIEKLSDALHPYLSSKKKQEIIEPLKGLADKGYLYAQVEMAYKGSSNYEQVYAYADKAAKYMQEDDYFKGAKSDQAMKVSCALVNTVNNAKNPELRAKAEASLKQMADKGCFAAQETYANLMEERGDYGKASVYARKASDNEHASEEAQDRLSKYAHKMYQKHQKNHVAPKKESPQVLPPNRDNVKPKPGFKERLIDAGSKGAIGIIKASKAFAQTGLQLADTVLDSGVKMAGAFIDAPDLGIGRGLQGYLSKGINKAADVSISLIESARKKAGGR